MPAASDLIRATRTQSALSMRGLAAKAGVAYTTVHRIEQGDMDPTVGMLSKLLSAMGMELSLVSSMAEIPTVAELVDVLSPLDDGERIDWTRLRIFTDYLAWHPEFIGPATERAPQPSGSVFVDNLLAAITETVCDEARIPRPSWTKTVSGLDQKNTASGTPKMQEKSLKETLPQFLSRGLIVSRYDLWRKEPLTATGS
jgi:transcriptional regulator with XRE-family HTH domain